MLQHRREPKVSNWMNDSYENHIARYISLSRCSTLGGSHAHARPTAHGHTCAGAGAAVCSRFRCSAALRQAPFRRDIRLMGRQRERTVSFAAALSHLSLRLRQTATTP